eukprot:364496-Chlamydomonas_euryale.AAC.12
MRSVAPTPTAAVKRFDAHAFVQGAPMKISGNPACCGGVLPADDVRDVIRKHYDQVKCTPVGLSPMLDGWADDVSHLPRDDQTPAACTTTDDVSITNACGSCQAAAKGKAGVSSVSDSVQGMGCEAMDPFVPTPSMPSLLSQSCRSS